MTLTVSRRKFVSSSLTGAALLAGSSLMGKTDEPCVQTLRRGDGPFYPLQPIPSHADLTALPGRSGRAKGQVLYVFGKVSDVGCHPVSGARVEIWQADRNGRYNHQEDRSSTPLDEYFGYFSAVHADAGGAYLFKTIVPARYDVGDFKRAPHIHYKIKAEGFTQLSTELYFEDDHKYQATDPVFLSIPESKRPSLMVAKQRPEDFAGRDLVIEPGSICCQFDIVLQPGNAKNL